MPPISQASRQAHRRYSKAVHQIGLAPPVGRPAPNQFNAKHVLQRTGFRLRDEARSYGNDLDKVGGALDALGAGDMVGDIGNFALVVAGGVLGLIALELLLGDRGSTILADTTKWLGGGIYRLVSPTDPLTSPGSSTASAPSASAGASSSSPSSPSLGSSPDANVDAYFAKTSGVAYPTPSGTQSPVGNGSPYEVDSNYVNLVDWIEQHFGVSVTSGYRTATENAAAGGASNSDHLRGLAADFSGSPTALERLYRWATSAGFPYVESPAEAQAAGEGAHVHISFYRSPSSS